MKERDKWGGMGVRLTEGDLSGQIIWGEKRSWVRIAKDRKSMCRDRPK